MICKAFQEHWPEYLMEAAGLGFFMLAAGVITVVFEYQDSPVHQALPDPFLRLIGIGIGMGLTAIAIIYSPWGQQSGAHINPAVTLTFYRLGKIKPWDAVFYILAQFMGGLVGVWLAILILGAAFTHPPVNHIVTVPGAAGLGLALLGEAVIAFCMMMTILMVSNTPKLGRWTGVFAGCLVCLYVIFEAPLSGFGMNPARTFASALPAHIWTAFWMYLLVPPAAMLLAAEVYVRFKGLRAVACAKLNHHTHTRCIFRCEYRYPETPTGD
ncbi:MIP/aquaporin family protein [Neosynechococcus sphagnicola]|uniref:MIP/aquaporin family protein n=1 Tax=Neosynechococcus sphagnicola TaxID=1501145 RepID=UPI000565D7E6|nr:aquaporin [Neosynechococcus sphagnicola]